MKKTLILVTALAGLTACGSSGGGAAITLTTGFSPDPTTVTGSAGGGTAASSLNSECNGNVGSSPNHVMTLGAAFPQLRIMAHSAADTTLVVRRPDGTFLCNDDSDGLDPMVEGAFAAGEYQIYVGSYNADERPSYTLGVSAGTTATPSQLQ